MIDFGSRNTSKRYFGRDYAMDVLVVKLGDHFLEWKEDNLKWFLKIANCRDWTNDYFAKTTAVVTYLNFHLSTNKWKFNNTRKPFTSS